LPDYHDWRDRSNVFEGLGAFYYGDFNLSAGESPELVQGAYITANFFQTLQVPPALGRLFNPEEEQFGKHRVVLLSDKLWQRRFAGATDVVGREIRLGGEAFTVAGVMPRGMPFFDNLPEVELWTPIAFAPKDSMATRNNHFLNIVGRLKPGVSMAQAQSDVAAIARAIEEVESTNKGVGAARRSRIRPFGCVRKRRQPVVGPRLGSKQGTGDSREFGSESRAHCSSGDDRVFASRADRRCVRCVAGNVGHRSNLFLTTRLVAARKYDRRECARAGIHLRARNPDDARLWLIARVPGSPH
jgi:hypothetical protein